jgi:hypothetical protein
VPKVLVKWRCSSLQSSCARVLLRRKLYRTNLPVIYMSFNSFEETEKSHKEAPVEITGYPKTLPALKRFSPSPVS